MCSTTVGLDLIVEFVYVVCSGQQEKFCLHFYLTSQEKTTKPQVLFENPKGTLDLNGAINPQENTFVGIDTGLHLVTLSLKVFGDVKVFTPLLQWRFAFSFDAPGLVWAAVTVSTGIYGGHDGVSRF